MQTHRSLVDLQDEQEAEAATGIELGSSELLQRLHLAHAGAGFAAALAEIEGLHRKGQADAEALETDGRCARSGARTLAANVPWLEANPGALQDLGQPPPAAVCAQAFANADVPMC